MNIGGQRNLNLDCYSRAFVMPDFKYDCLWVYLYKRPKDCDEDPEHYVVDGCVKGCFHSTGEGFNISINRVKMLIKLFDMRAR